LLKNFVIPNLNRTNGVLRSSGVTPNGVETYSIIVKLLLYLSIQGGIRGFMAIQSHPLPPHQNSMGLIFSGYHSFTFSFTFNDEIAPFLTVSNSIEPNK
jgi:hypothetical protein